MEKKRPIDYLTYEELMLGRVLRRAIECAKTMEELEEAKQCMGHLMAKIPKRMKKELEQKK